MFKIKNKLMLVLLFLFFQKSNNMINFFNKLKNNCLKKLKTKNQDLVKEIIKDFDKNNLKENEIFIGKNDNKNIINNNNNNDDEKELSIIYKKYSNFLLIFDINEFRESLTSMFTLLDIKDYTDSVFKINNNTQHLEELKILKNKKSLNLDENICFNCHALQQKLELFFEQNIKNYYNSKDPINNFIINNKLKNIYKFINNIKEFDNELEAFIKTHNILDQDEINKKIL